MSVAQNSDARRSRSFAPPVLSRSPAVTSVYGRNVSNLAHVSDVLRLRAVTTHGGVYMDSDVLPLRNLFTHLSSVPFALGVQAAGATANAVVVARPHAPFAYRWADEYHSFDGADWDGHSVKLPFSLALRHPDEVLWLPNSAFFVPSWNEHPETSFSLNITASEWAGQPARMALHLWHQVNPSLDAVADAAWFGAHACTLYGRLVLSIAAEHPGGRVADALGEHAGARCE